ncbi:MAG: ATP-binding cassette domain-containing protein [Planctomycetaceae bacterium]
MTPSLQTTDPGSWVLEQLSLLKADVEMAAARRAWHEARLAWPGDENRLWWKWLSEAAHSLGFQTRVVDCTHAELMRLVADGARIITCNPANQEEWLVIRQQRRRRIEVLRTQQNDHRKHLRPRQLNRVLRTFDYDGRLRCVIIRSDMTSGIEAAHGMSPLSRLQALLRPEWSDVWIIAVFAFVVGLLTLATPIAVEALVNTVAFGRFIQPVFVLALILLTFLAFSAAMRGLQTYVSELVQRRLFVRVAGDLAFRLPRADTESCDGIYLPELTNRFFDVVTVQKVVSQLLLDGLGLVLSAVIGMGVLAFYHPWLLGFDVVMLASIAFIILVLGRGAVSSAIKESKKKYSMAAWLEDLSRCRTVFRTSGGTDLALERTDRLVHEYLESREKHFSILMRQILFALGLQALASTALLGLGGWLVIDGQLTLGQLVAAELIVTVIVGAFAKLGKHMESFYDLLAAVDKLGALFDLKTERRDGLLDFPCSDGIDVTVSDVTYQRSGSGRLKTPVSFDVASRASLAILGGSGRGKSVLMDLLAGRRAPTTGRISFNNLDPLELRPDVLRLHVTLVREGEIFGGTLEENIHLHRTQVSSADVRQALDVVGLYETVLDLRDGFDTRLEGDGVPLSVTQQKLLCLARAIAGRPALLLIDGTLDGLPDDELTQVLSGLLADDRPWSLIIATGRQDVAERCSQIHRMDSGVEKSRRSGRTS